MAQAEPDPEIQYAKRGNQNFFPVPEGQRGPTNNPPINETVTKLSILAAANAGRTEDAPTADDLQSDDGRDRFDSEKAVKDRPRRRTVNAD